MPLNLSDRRKRGSIERVFKIRLVNVKQLRKAYRTREEFARVCGFSPAFASHISGDNPIRTIGEKLARSIEISCGLPSGWLDMVH